MIGPEAINDSSVMSVTSIPTLADVGVVIVLNVVDSSRCGHVFDVLAHGGRVNDGFCGGQGFIGDDRHFHSNVC